jgi:hypothetical protein
MADSPLAIEKFRLEPVLSSVAQKRYPLRAPVERAFTQDSEAAPVIDSAPQIDAPSLYNPVLDAADRKPISFNWSVLPQVRQQFSIPTLRSACSCWVVVAAFHNRAPGLSISGQGEPSVFDTFATDRPNYSMLPHVHGLPGRT